MPVTRKGAGIVSVDEIIEYLRTLPKGTVVRVLVMDKASGHLWSSIVENVVDGDVWCREDVGTLIEDKGKNPRPRTSTGCWLPCRAGLAPSATGLHRRVGTSCTTSTTMPSTPSDGAHSPQPRRPSGPPSGLPKRMPITPRGRLDGAGRPSFLSENNSESAEKQLALLDQG